MGVYDGMGDIRITAQRREKVGKENSKKIRRAGFIPAVMYSGGKVHMHIQVRLSDMNKILKNGATKFEVEVDGKIYKVALKDVQIHPLTDQPIHFDFYVLSDN